MPQSASQVTDLPQSVATALSPESPVWTTTEMQNDFSVDGFAAPFVVVVRKSDGQKGSLQFCSNPRYYFAFVEDSP